MTTVYIVMDAGLEYNDETYEIQNWLISNNKAHDRLPDAEKAAEKRLRKLASEFTLGDLGWDWGYDPESKYILKNMPDTESDHWGYTYGDWIEYAEANGIDWKPGIPELVKIQEIII